MRLGKRLIEGPLTTAGIAAGHRLILALGATWKLHHVGGARVSAARRTGGPVLYVASHGEILPLVYTYRNRNVHVMVSESRDGEIIARVTGRLGWGAVRGSTTRGGRRAMEELIARGREGHDVAITPDGPRGPRGSVAPGTPLVAGRADVPVVPIGVAARSAWHASSWDRFLVPRPFADVWIVYGEPIRVATGDDVAEACARIEAEMAAASRRAGELAAGGTADEPGTRVPA